MKKSNTDEEDYLKLCEKFGVTPQYNEYGLDVYGAHSQELTRKQKAAWRSIQANQEARSGIKSNEQ